MSDKYSNAVNYRACAFIENHLSVNAQTGEMSSYL